MMVINGQGGVVTSKLDVGKQRFSVDGLSSVLGILHLSDDKKVDKKWSQPSEGGMQVYD